MYVLAKHPQVLMRIMRMRQLIVIVIGHLVTITLMMMEC